MSTAEQLLYFRHCALVSVKFQGTLLDSHVQLRLHSLETTAHFTGKVSPIVGLPFNGCYILILAI